MPKNENLKNQNREKRKELYKMSDIWLKFKLWIIAVCITVFIMMIIDLIVNPKKEIVTDLQVCPEVLYNQYWTWCLDHINEWYPWKLTASWDSQLMPELVEQTSHDRFKELCQKYWLNASAIWEVENKYNLREWIILAIIIAETSGGKNGYWVEWCWNYGNVWNNDRGDRYCFTSESEGLHKIWKTLSNQFLGTTQTLGCLSKAWSCTWWEDKGHIYASSKWNWERTILNVLNAIYQDELWNIDPKRFNVRRIFTIYQ